MRRISPDSFHRHQRHSSARSKRRPPDTGAERDPASTGVATLVPAFSQSLPVFDGVPAEYIHEFHAELLYELCAALVREGLAGTETWRNVNENAVAFAQRAILDLIGRDRLEVLQRNIDYQLTVSDALERDGDETTRSDGRLVLSIECTASGFLKLGPAIEALEREAPGLGAAFYWTLIDGLYRVVRIYGHEEAFEYEDRLRDYAAQDNENPEQYEFPEVEKAFPECIRQTLKRDGEQFARQARKILRRHRKGRYRAWVERLVKIRWFSRRPLWADRMLVEDGQYDDPPLPSLVVAFREQDAIVACFDEERQYMLEASHEPAIGVAFSAQKPVEFHRALRIARRFVALNLTVCELLEEIERWEKDHGGTH